MEKIAQIMDWTEKRYSCLVVPNKWDKDFSACVGYDSPYGFLFVVNYSSDTACLHEIGHVIDYCELGFNAIMNRPEVINELEAWRIAENLAYLFNIELDYDYWELAIASYVIKGLQTGTLTEDKANGFFW